MPALSRHRFLPPTCTPHALVLVAAAITAFCGGCYPMLAHSPHVEDGPAMAVRVGPEVGELVRTPSGGSTRSRPLGATMELALGMRRHEDGAASRVALGLNLFAAAITVDAYGEFAAGRFGALDAGLGVSGQSGLMPLVLPYAEFGRRYGDGKLWFVSNGVGAVRTGGDNHWHAIWMPTLAFGGASVRRTWFVFATAVIGGRGADCLTGHCEEYWPLRRTYLLVGLAGERTFRRPVLVMPAR